MKLSLFMTLTALTLALVVAQPPKGTQPGNPDQHGPSKGKHHRESRYSQKGKDPRNPSHSKDWPEGKGKDTRNSGDFTSKSKGREPSDRRGHSYCTYAPDYKCYKSGWPSCCNGTKGSRSCPRRRPSCDRSPNHPSSKSVKSTTTDTTKRSSRNIRRRCVPDDRPRTRRAGQHYHFELVRSSAQCVDEDGELYEYGQIDGVRDFSDCTDACVQNVRSSLLDSGGFRGVDFDCRSGECRCLYDEGTLHSHNSRGFDRTNRNEYGYGPIDGAKRVRRSRDTYCGRLVGSDFVMAGELLEADVTELWSMNDQ